MAGTVKAQVQLGDSNTATQNFVLTSEAADGTMKLARGNKGATTQDILTVDAAGKVVFPQNAQAWQDVLTSPGRAIGVVYTNSTGQPIKVAISGGGVAGASVAQIRWATNSVIRGYMQASTFNGTTYSAMTWQLYFEVPAGSTYTIDNHAGTNTLFTWMELR